MSSILSEAAWNAVLARQLKQLAAVDGVTITAQGFVNSKPPHRLYTQHGGGYYTHQNGFQQIEFECMKNIGLDETDADNFISQIKYDKKGMYEPNLSVKLPFSYNRFQTDIYSEHSSTINLFQIQGFTPMECDIYLDKIWKMNGKYYAKWKCKTIHLV